MKHLSTWLFACFLTIILSPSCNTATPIPSRGTGIREMKGKVLLQNGNSVNCVIMANIYIPTSEDGYLRVKVDGRPETNRILIKDLKGFVGNGVYYEPRKANTGGIGRPQLYFMRRLTRDTSRIHLFVAEMEITDLVSNSTFRPPPREIESDFFMVSPGQQENYEAIHLRSRKLSPNFDEKMIAFVPDCPDLVEKIKQKTKGYFYNDIAPNQVRVDIMMNIIDAYNACR